MALRNVHVWVFSNSTQFPVGRYSWMKMLNENGVQTAGGNSKVTSQAFS